MGAVSMTFALVTVLGFRLWVALPFAVTWGLVIVCMDRVFVVTLQRRRGWLALPRIALALLLGFVVSTPFVLQIFRPEIENEITTLHRTAATSYFAHLPTDSLTKQIAVDQGTVAGFQATADTGGSPPDIATNQTIVGLDAKLKSDQASEQNDYYQEQCQLYDIPPPGGGKCKPGQGQLATQSEDEYNYYKGLVAQDQQDITNATNTIETNYKNSRQQAIAQAQAALPAAVGKLHADQALQSQQTKQFENNNAGDTGLLVRLQALNIVAGKNSTLEWTRWLLFALFVAIDLMPVMMKVLINWAPAGNYEKLLSNEEATQLEVAENERAAFKHTQFKASRTIIGSSQDRLAGLSAAIPEVQENIIAARRRIEQEWLRTWEETQLRRIAGGQAITPSDTGVNRAVPDAPAEMPETFSGPRAPSGPPASPRHEEWRGRESSGRSWLRDFWPRDAWWRESTGAQQQRSGGQPSYDTPQPTPVTLEWRGTAPRPRRRRSRDRLRAGFSWSPGLFQRRVPGNTTPEDQGSPRMFMREFVPPDQNGSAGQSQDPGPGGCWSL